MFGFVFLPFPAHTVATCALQVGGKLKKAMFLLTWGRWRTGKRHEKLREKKKKKKKLAFSTYPILGLFCWKLFLVRGRTWLHPTRSCSTLPLGFTSANTNIICEVEPFCTWCEVTVHIFYPLHSHLGCAHKLQDDGVRLSPPLQNHSPGACK